LVRKVPFMNIPQLLSRLFNLLPVLVQQKLDSLNNPFLRRLRVSEGPLVMEPCFNIVSIPVIHTPETEKFVGFCACGAPLNVDDKVVFLDVADANPVSETTTPLDSHKLIRKVDGVLCNIHCLKCQLGGKVPKGVKGFANLGEDGVLVMDRVNVFLGF